MPKLPYMPLFVDDFFGGTMRWDAEKQALYVLLLMHQWASGPLPAKPDDIAEAIHHRDPRRFEKAWDVIKQKFSRTQEGWVNERLEEVRAHSFAVASERSRAGKKGAEAKAKAKQMASNAEAIASANGQAIASAKVTALRQPGSSIQSNPIQTTEEEAIQGGRA